jgi:hypothetical protein
MEAIWMATLIAAIALPNLDVQSFNEARYRSKTGIEMIANICTGVVTNRSPQAELPFQS